jgi:uncharacterized protein (DUF1501 family)
MAGARITNMAFAIGEDNPEILIVLFLRGGWDSLNVVPPIAVSTDRGEYERLRPGLKVPTSGANAALPLDSFFGLHPSMGALHNLYQAQRLAVIHAAGLVYDTRSHFDAMQFMELGTPGVKNAGTGWVTRYLQSLTLPPTAALPALSAGSSRAASLAGYIDAVALSSPSTFNLGGSSQYRGQQTTALRNMYGSNADWLGAAGLEAINTVDLIASKSVGAYTPSNGAVYPANSFGDQLKLIAQMIKLGVGLTAATIDLGGWDTHENQGSAAASYMGTLLTTLSNGLAAFYLDLENCGGSTDYAAKTTMVVMSEFGRRLKENANIGTDHGHGSVMLVLGKTVKGGKVYGQWPGLQNDQLYQREDLAITTDYRRVLSEILKVRTGRTDAQLTSIFPGYTQEQPLDFMHASSDPLPDPFCANLTSRKVYLPFIRR